MKLDKETVVKHQFWFLLGTYLVVWLVAVLWDKFAAAGPIQKAKDSYNTNKSRLAKAAQKPINARTFIPPWEQYGQVFDKHKRVIWDEAWELQKGMYDWPSELSTNKDMSTPQTELTQDEREEFQRKLYPGEIKALKDWTPRLLGPIELAGGFDDFFKPQKWTDPPTREECWLAQEDYWVKRELLIVIGYAVASQASLYSVPLDDKKEPMPEGVLQRFRFHNESWEITLLIKLNKDKLPVIAGDSTIKNVQAGQHPQSLTSAKGTGIVFNVYQDRTVAAFEVKGEPVPWEATQKLDKADYRPLNGIDWSKTKEHPIYLSQSFDWSTCPVRRIEAMEVAKQSARTHTMGLFPNDTLAKLDASGEPGEDPKQPAGGAVPGGAPMGMGGGGMPPAPGGPMAGMKGPMMPGGPPGAPGGASSKATNVTANNQIDRDRYLQPPKAKDETEKPSRHLPIALQLILDQAHVHDLLVALANSRLRIQITQVDLQRVHGGLKPPDADKSGNQLRTGGMYMPPGMAGMYGPMSGGGRSMRRPGGGGPMRPPGGGPMMPPGGGPTMPGGGSTRRPGGPMPGPMGNMPYGGMSMMPGRGGSGSAPPNIMSPTGAMGPMGPMGDQGAKKSASSQDDENLVELTIYGIATLYRKPDPPTADAQGVPPSQPVPPTPPAQPTGTTAPATTGQTPPAENKPDEKKPEEKKADEKKADEKKADEKKADEKKADEKKAPAEKKD